MAVNKYYHSIKVHKKSQLKSSPSHPNLLGKSTSECECCEVRFWKFYEVRSEGGDFKWCKLGILLGMYFDATVVFFTINLLQIGSGHSVGVEKLHSAHTKGRKTSNIFSWLQFFQKITKIILLYPLKWVT